MDEDARQHEELREQYNLQERRLSLLQTELEEVRSALEGSERSRKLLEQEVVEITERHNEINIQVGWRLSGGHYVVSHSGHRGKPRWCPNLLGSPQNSEAASAPLVNSSELICRAFICSVEKKTHNTKCTILAISQCSVLTTCGTFKEIPRHSLRILIQWIYCGIPKI